METVLVTGGAGFIGSHLCESLLKQDYRVICVDLLDNDLTELKLRNVDNILSNPNFFLYSKNINIFEEISSIFESNQIDYVINLAAKTGVRDSFLNPELYFETNIFGLFNVLKLASKYKVKKFIFSSSSSVYGNNKKIPFSENDLVENQISPYAVSKRSGELLCKMFSDLNDLDVVCFRFFTVYGPRGREDMAISKFVRAIDSGEHISLFGDGTSQRDYTYVSDIVDGIVASLKLKSRFEIINLGDSNPITLINLVRIIERVLGKTATIDFLSSQVGDVDVTFADISKANKLLNYVPKVSVETGIAKFVEWYKN
ncbi:SDR family NAD(P)-dependent oxidoreductase [Candidatus Woesearchaeota archaeon]|nr:SDR family NAD(P)-dependent oxidoreductase [Candidatus Woesearchaeota archaeon]